MISGETGESGKTDMPEHGKREFFGIPMPLQAPPLLGFTTFTTFTSFTAYIILGGSTHSTSCRRFAYNIGNIWRQ